MKSLLQEIKESLVILSNKDVELCNRLIEERKIDSLKEIIDSYVIKLTKKIKKSTNLELEEDLESFNILKNKVDTYYKACGYEDLSYEKDDLEIEDDEEYYGEY